MNNKEESDSNYKNKTWMLKIIGLSCPAVTMEINALMLPQGILTMWALHSNMQV